MDDNIVHLPTKKPAPQAWHCVCGCSTFNLYSDGREVCAACASVRSADLLAEDVKAEFHVIDTNDEGNAKALIRSRVMAHDVALVVVVREDGSLSTWTNSSDDRWIEAMMAMATSLVKLRQ